MVETMSCTKFTDIMDSLYTEMGNLIAYRDEHEALEQSHARMRAAVEEVTGVKTLEGDRGDRILIAQLLLRKEKPDAEPHPQRTSETSQASETEDQSAS